MLINLSASDAANPYYVLRTAAKKTQKYIADLLDIQEQSVRRLEHGLFNTGNRDVARELIDCLPSDFIKGNTTSEKIDAVMRDYAAWQAVRRRTVGEFLKKKGYENPPGVVSPIDFRLWLMSYVVSDEDEVSVFQFCRLFSLHPYTVQRWETGAVKSSHRLTLPPSMEQALAQAGLDTSHVVFARGRARVSK